MPRSKSAKDTKEVYPEIENIREDIDNLKNNIIELTQHLGQDGKSHLHSARERLNENAEALKSTGQEKLETTRHSVQERPLQSLGIALAAGAALGLLMGRK